MFSRPATSSGCGVALTSVFAALIANQCHSPDSFMQWQHYPEFFQLSGKRKGTVFDLA